MFGKCNCGRDIRYSHFQQGVEVGSCNKHIVCPPYDELEEQIRMLRQEICQLGKDKETLIKTIKLME